MLCHPQRSRTSGSRSWFSQTRRIGSAPLWTMTPPWLWRRKVTTPAQTFQMWRTDSSTPERKIRSRSADSTTFAFFAITGYTQLSEPHWTLKHAYKNYDFSMNWYPFDLQTCSMVLSMKGKGEDFASLYPDQLQYLGKDEVNQYVVYTYDMQTLPDNPSQVFLNSNVSIKFQIKPCIRLRL